MNSILGVQANIGWFLKILKKSFVFRVNVGGSWGYEKGSLVEERVENVVVN